VARLLIGGRLVGRLARLGDRACQRFAVFAKRRPRARQRRSGSAGALYQRAQDQHGRQSRTTGPRCPPCRAEPIPKDQRQPGAGANQRRHHQREGGQGHRQPAEPLLLRQRQFLGGEVGAQQQQLAAVLEHAAGSLERKCHRAGA